MKVRILDQKRCCELSGRGGTYMAGSGGQAGSAGFTQLIGADGWTGAAIALVQEGGGAKGGIA